MTSAGPRPDCTSLFAVLGEGAGVHRLVERLYDRLLADARVARYFAQVDMPRLKRHQVLLLSQLLGGPAQYDGRTLREAHAGLGITRCDYQVVCDQLEDALRELGAEAEQVGAVRDLLARLEEEIVLPAATAAAEAAASAAPAPGATSTRGPGGGATRSAGTRKDRGAPA